MSKIATVPLRSEAKSILCGAQSTSIANKRLRSDIESVIWTYNNIRKHFETEKSYIDPFHNHLPLKTVQEGSHRGYMQSSKEDQTRNDDKNIKLEQWRKKREE